MKVTLGRESLKFTVKKTKDDRGCGLKSDFTGKVEEGKGLKHILNEIL